MVLGFHRGSGSAAWWRTADLPGRWALLDDFRLGICCSSPSTVAPWSQKSPFLKHLLSDSTLDPRLLQPSQQPCRKTQLFHKESGSERRGLFLKTTLQESSRRRVRAWVCLTSEGPVPAVSCWGSSWQTVQQSWEGQGLCRPGVVQSVLGPVLSLPEPRLPHVPCGSNSPVPALLLFTVLPLPAATSPARSPAHSGVLKLGSSWPPQRIPLNPPPSAEHSGVALGAQGRN